MAFSPLAEDAGDRGCRDQNPNREFAELGDQLSPLRCLRRCGKFIWAESTEPACGFFSGQALIQIRMEYRGQSAG